MPRRFPSFPGGGGDDRGFRDMLRWQLQRWRNGVAPDPPASALPRAESNPAYDFVQGGEVRITWIGHATSLIQLPGVNILTDPVWSERASPITWLGPTRLVPAALRFEQLPPVQVVLLSHDHYDHLDRPTMLRLYERYGDELTFITPLGYRAWFERLGITRVAELDWWQSADVGGTLRVTATPARHWTRRKPWDGMSRLWCSFALRSSTGGSVYFGGDSGYAPIFTEIGQRCGPFDVSMLPIGAYEPRWFMHPAHMDPEEAVQSWVDLGARGEFVPLHWGTFRLTDEPVLEPPRRLREAWLERRLPADHLHILRHGETLILSQPAPSP